MTRYSLDFFQLGLLSINRYQFSSSVFPPFFTTHYFRLSAEVLNHFSVKLPQVLEAKVVMSLSPFLSFRFLDDFAFLVAWVSAAA